MQAIQSRLPSNGVCDTEYNYFDKVVASRSVYPLHARYARFYLPEDHPDKTDWHPLQALRFLHALYYMMLFWELDQYDALPTIGPIECLEPFRKDPIWWNNVRLSIQKFTVRLLENEQQPFHCDCVGDQVMLYLMKEYIDEAQDLFHDPLKSATNLHIDPTGLGTATNYEATMQRLEQEHASCQIYVETETDYMMDVFIALTFRELRNGEMADSKGYDHPVNWWKDTLVL